ncbi:MAG TPA: hypothetical protein DDZ67_07220, partial [Xanthomonadaceae bacterium]|nr:hypothetical protein [Xanthomonadaceae bacterium]
PYTTLFRSLAGTDREAAIGIAHDLRGDLAQLLVLHELHCAIGVATYGGSGDPLAAPAELLQAAVPRPLFST